MTRPNPSSWYARLEGLRLSVIIDEPTAYIERDDEHRTGRIVHVTELRNSEGDAFVEIIVELDVPITSGTLKSPIISLSERFSREPISSLLEKRPLTLNICVFTSLERALEPVEKQDGGAAYFGYGTVVLL
jgi:hypothetical protein